MSTQYQHKKRDCDCCSGVEPITPRRVINPPGLLQFAYRMGRHKDFYESIQARLSSENYPALAALSTRESSDFSIAIADGLACSLDVLSFYTERFAHEHYLRTATERLSVGEMARLIGYQLAPGVAASTHLAFTLQSVPGSVAPAIKIPVGTRVQSVPGQDEQAQTFETVSLASAKAEWNAINVQQNEFKMPVFGDTQLWLEGIDTGLIVGDLILIVGAEQERDPQGERWDVRVITALDTDTARRLTRVSWQLGLGHARPFVLPAHESVKVYTFRTRAAAFGHMSPDWRSLSDDSKAGYIGLLSADELQRPEDTQEWPDFSVRAPVFPERRSGSAELSETLIAATVDDIVLAANSAAHGAAAMAMHRAATAGTGVVMAGGKIAEGAMHMARESAEGLSEVANLAVNEVTQRARTLIHAQGQSLQALQLSAESLVSHSALDFSRQVIGDRIAGLPARVQALTAQGLTYPAEIARAVLDDLIDILEPENGGVPLAVLPNLQPVWDEAVDSVKQAVATVQGELDDDNPPTWFSVLEGAGAALDGAGAALERVTLSLADLEPEFDIASDTPASIVGEVVGKLRDAVGAQLSDEKFKDLLNLANVFGSVQEWTESLFDAGGAVGESLLKLQNNITNSAGVMFSKLGQDVARMAQEAQLGITDTAALLNPAQALAALGDAAIEMKELTHSAGVAALGAAAAADVAALVSTAVTIARSLPAPFPPATPESIAEVARHFAAVGVMRAGGPPVSESASGSMMAQIESIMPTSLQVPLELVEQLLPMVEDAEALLNAPRHAAEAAYQRIVVDVDRALVGKIVVVSGRRAPLVRTPDEIDLSHVHDSVIAGGWALLSVPNSIELYKIKSAVSASRAEYLMSGQTTRLGLKGELPEGRLPGEFEHAVRSLSVHVDSEELALAHVPLDFPVYGETIALAGHVEELAPEQPLAISGKRQRIVMARGITNLVLVCNDGTERPLVEGDSLILMAAPQRLNSGAPSYVAPRYFAQLIGKRAFRLQLTLKDRDGCIGEVGLSGTDFMLDVEREDDPVVSEVVFLVGNDDAVSRDRDRSYLKLTSATRHTYSRISTRVNANVAPATHGESVDAMLGSGDGGRADQSFVLNQKPLTYISANTSSGRSSTLQLRVNDALWSEVPMLHGETPDARVYETLHSDDAVTKVNFGDGNEGARLPSGESNVRVTYRKGIGTVGNLDAGQLTTLLSRPLGVSDVVNPEAATGGEDAESLARARSNAPLTVLTLERVVSEDDYANFARAFAGIDKAHALWISVGPARGVFLTIAGIDGAAVPESSDTFRNLRDALVTYGDPLVPLRITNYSLVRFRCRLSIKVQTEHEVERVLDSVDVALRAHFGFAQRSLGQTVSADEVIAVAQTVNGVEGVHLTRLNRLATAVSSVEPRLFATLPVSSLIEQPLPGELLTISDDIELEVLP